MAEPEGAALVATGDTLTHPSGQTYTLVDDDAERMTCERVGDLGHSMCGVHPCCGWPRFLVCPDDPRLQAEASAEATDG